MGWAVFTIVQPTSRCLHDNGTPVLDRAVRLTILRSDQASCPADDRLLGHDAELAGDFPAMREEDERWNGADCVAAGNGLLRVWVELAQKSTSSGMSLRTT